MSQLADKPETFDRGAFAWGKWMPVIEQWSRIKFGQLRTCLVCGWREYAYEIMVDEDDLLQVQLHWDSSDSAAGDDLNLCCSRVV